jgi:hypothetical protein
MVLVLVCLVWGFTVVTDSAQFSACISELCRVEYVGTALTLQTSIGFLLTLGFCVSLHWSCRWYLGDERAPSDARSATIGKRK